VLYAPHSRRRAGESLDALRGRHAVGPLDVAEALMCPVSDAGELVTGTAFVIDGALTEA
jgi:hypothetical protein